MKQDTDQKRSDKGNNAIRTSDLHVCMVAYTFYESDNRVRRYAEALASRGDEVDVISLRERGGPFKTVLRGVNVYHIQKRMKNEKAKLTFLLKLLLFLIKSTYFITKRHLQKPYKVIHVHSVPDFEVFSTFIAKKLGAKSILDIHDIVPEFYASKFNTTRDGIFFKVLVWLEKLSIGFSDHVIIANHIWEKVILERSVSNKEKCSVFLNYPDKEIFIKRPKSEISEKFRMLYPGSLNFHQGLDIAIRAMNKIKNEFPEAELHIYGNGGYKPVLLKLVRDLGLEKRVYFHNPESLDRIASIISDAHLGIVPKRNDSFGGEAFSTKIFEFMTVEVPVIVSRTKIDQYYFNDSVVKFFKPEDVDDLAESMRLLIQNERLRLSLVQNALMFMQNYNWDIKKQDYFDLVDSLAGMKDVAKPPERAANLPR